MSTATRVMGCPAITGQNVTTSSKFNNQEIKGLWAFALKVHITIVSVILPLFTGWMIWITSEQFKDHAYRTSTERFTQTDGRTLEDKMTNGLGPKIEKVDMRMQSLERDTTRIFTKLEQIEQALKTQ